MSSPAQRHRQRVEASLAASNAGAEETGVTTGNAYELMLAKLAEDKRKLSAIQSVEKKIELKRTLLPEYVPWCQGILSADTGTRDDVFATIMVWLIDAGSIDDALILAAHMLKHDLPLPEQYKRDLPTLLVEEIAERAGNADGGNVSESNLLEVGQLTEGRDMPDEVRAKLHKATGLALREAAPAQALEHLQRALQLNARIGVKQEIDKLEKQLSSNTPSAK